MTFPHEAQGEGGHLWNAVCKTYPSATKQVNLGARQFTAIDAYSQIKRATEVFGAVGDGWGWDIRQIQHMGASPNDVVTVTIELWYRPPLEGDAADPMAVGKKSCFSSVGCAQLTRLGKDKKVRVDTDAVKKATTDAITKGLSYLGFNADVFFGAFDSNKYVEAMRREEAEASKATKEGKVQAKPRQETRPMDVGSGDNGEPLDMEPKEGGSEPTGKVAEAVKKAGQEPAKGPPKWFPDLIGGDSKHKDRTWEWMSQGGPDGGRHGYLRWMFQSHRTKVILKRVAWMLEKFYGDTEAKDGTLKTALDDDDTPF